MEREKMRGRERKSKREKGEQKIEIMGDRRKREGEGKEGEEREWESGGR